MTRRPEHQKWCVNHAYLLDVFLLPHMEEEALFYQAAFAACKGIHACNGDLLYNLLCG